jgi:hypothetical protein
MSYTLYQEENGKSKTKNQKVWAFQKNLLPLHSARVIKNGW